MIAFDVILRALWSPKSRKRKQDGEEGNDEEARTEANNAVSSGNDGKIEDATGNGKDKEAESKR